MKTFRLALCCAASACLLPLATYAVDPAADLAAQLSAIRQDGTSSVRLKMEIKQGSTTHSYQLQTKERKGKGSTDIVYQILWPKERKGEAVLLRKSSRGTTGAILTLPDKVQTISAGQMNEGLFGGDLSYSDIVENFFAWESQAIVGTESVGRVECQILESKPKGASSPYASVRSWIDAKRLVPLRVEKYGSSGKLACRIETTNVEKDDLDRHLPASLTITRSGGSVTTIQGTRIRHGVSLTDRDFSPEGMGDLTAPRS